MKSEAIHNLYSNVTQTVEDADGNITAYDINGNEVNNIDMSVVETKATELQAEADAKAQSEIDNKASAKAKLIAGEALTEEEANAIVL